MPGTDRSLPLKQEKALSQRVRDEMLDQLNGGTDFPLAALTCALCLLAQPAHQRWQDEIREPGEEKATAFLNEVLRLFPPAVGCQPRELLRTVVLPYQKVSIALHPGVVVHAQPFTLHRDGEKFSDPVSFQPERWLGDGATKVSDLWAFGKGPTHCIAQEFAMKAMKTMLKVGCETARIDVEADSLALRPSQGLLLSLPEEMLVRVRLRQ